MIGTFVHVDPVSVANIGADPFGVGAMPPTPTHIAIAGHEMASR